MANRVYNEEISLIPWIGPFSHPFTSSCIQSHAIQNLFYICLERTSLAALPMIGESVKIIIEAENEIEREKERESGKSAHRSGK